MTTEEQELYVKLVKIKRSNELLTVIFEELDELLNSDNNKLLNTAEMEGLVYSYNEYKKWKNENPSR
jgi:hypothetical protein